MFLSLDEYLYNKAFENNQAQSGTKVTGITTKTAS